MRLAINKNRFELLDCTPDEGKLAIKRGLKLDGRRFCYYTHSASLLWPYEGIVQPTPEVVKAVLQHRASVFLSKGTDCNVNIPLPTKEEYLPFQKVGILYSAARQRSLIADEPGLGKTVQAIGVMNYIPTIKAVLVVCPAIIKLNWIRELQKWFLRYEGADVAYSPVESRFPFTKIVVINYDIVDKCRPEIDKIKWDLLICDECQYIKDSTSKRSKAILGWHDFKKHINHPGIEAARKLFLSGTPLVNRPEDLWTVAKQCDPEDLGASWDYFAHRYCQLWRAPWGWDSSGAANLEELQDRLRGRFMVRRLKQDVLTDLPPKRRQIVVIQPKTADAELVGKEAWEFNQIQTRWELTIQAAQAAIDASKQRGDLEGYEKEARGLSSAQLSEFTEFSKLRKLAADAKIPYAIEYIRLMLDEHKKVVVFAHHISMIEALRKAFDKIKVAVIIGGQDDKERQSNIDAFQENLDYRLAIVSITTAVGYQLTAAAYALAVEFDWRPTVMTQCEDRLHRIGQKDAVLVQHLAFANSIDVNELKKIISKQEVIDRALG